MGEGCWALGVSRIRLLVSDGGVSLLTTGGFLPGGVSRVAPFWITPSGGFASVPDAPTPPAAPPLTVPLVTGLVPPPDVAFGAGGGAAMPAGGGSTTLPATVCGAAAAAAVAAAAAAAAWRASAKPGMSG